MANRHHWSASEEEIVDKEVSHGKLPKDIHKLLPHIPLPSIQYKVSKFRSKRPKLDASGSQETKSSRGKFIILYIYFIYI